MRLRLLAFVVPLITLCVGPAVAQQQDFSKVEIQSEKVADGIYMLTGSGGNMGLSIGEDGTYLIDDQYAPLTPKILAAIKELTPDPVRFVFNTHYHGDHTGGNENMGEAGAFLVAHENVRRRMATGTFMKAFNRQVEPAPAGALPVVTFSDAISFHWNGEEIRAFFVGPAHTDGDSIIHFVKADVFHMGDTLFNGMYPFIDVSAGGRIDGFIAAADRVLKVAGDETRLIPGHGPLATKADLQAFRDMLAEVRDRVAKLKAEGKTAEEIVAAKPTADLDEKWGGGFMKPDDWVGLVIESMK
ncbi:MAG: MBL fold metallo-hydrolase [Acidobacteria bacterium]|jgi:glyoxylase-like metal-dependent hydrolase (beta-lactamase superfamily II)|nr:MBL fold metallo-hydrolase [Acidobacteriota bacterium]